jgi:hypothetical protein
LFLIKRKAVSQHQANKESFDDQSTALHTVPDAAQWDVLAFGASFELQFLSDLADCGC